MSTQAETSLTPRRRVARGLAYTATGPVHITRGVSEIGYRSTKSVGRRVVAALAHVLHTMRRLARKRPALVVGGGVVVLAAGAIAFSIARRSLRQRHPERSEPTALPPSVNVQPQP